MIAIVTGLIGTYPLAGMTFHYLQYVLGLERLGWEVYYLEDTGGWTYDPALGTYTEACDANVGYLNEIMTAYGQAGAWSFRSHDGRHYGLDEPEIVALCKRADLFLNVSGACWLRETYQVPDRPTVYVDTDPGYTQIKVTRVAQGIGTGDEEYSVDLIAKHTHHFTFAENIGRPGCGVPNDVFDWQPTRQPILLDLWKEASGPGRGVYTTIMSWQPYKDGLPFANRTYFGKAPNLERIMPLPRHSTATFELALAGGAPRERLLACNWLLADAHAVSRRPSDYVRYIHESYGEFSVSKDIYVDFQTGWFSERSACYLASGRPVVVQDTGFSDVLPTGMGLLPFRTLEQALDAVDTVAQDHEAHCRAARDLAATWFDAATVLRSLVRKVSP